MGDVKYNQGSVPEQGKILAYNEAAGRMEWMDIAETAYVYEIEEFTASAGQTSFFFGGNLTDSGGVTPKVYINGNEQSFSHSGGTGSNLGSATFTLATGADSGATVRIMNTTYTPTDGMMLQFDKPAEKTKFKTLVEIIRDGKDSAEPYSIAVYDSDNSTGPVKTRWINLIDIVGHEDSSGKKDNAFIAYDEANNRTKWLSLDSALATGADSASTGDILIFDADAVDPNPKLKFSPPMVSIPVLFSDISSSTVNVTVKKGAYVSGSPAPSTTLSVSGVGISGNLTNGVVLGPATSNGTLAVTGAAIDLTLNNSDYTFQTSTTDSGDPVTVTVTDTDKVRRHSMAIITTPVPD